MRSIRISLVALGSLKYPFSVAQLESWQSKIVNIRHEASVAHLPDAQGSQWEYLDRQLLSLISPDSGFDFTLGLINAPLEDNFYLRRLTDRVAVLSLHEMADVVLQSDFTLEQYVLRNVYELAVLYAANGKLMPDNYESWAHDDVRGCIFDMNANKADIVFSLHRPVLCTACRVRVSSAQVPAMLLPTLDAELPKIQKSLYARMSQWIKKHPVAAIGITAVSSILLNLLASVIFEKGKHLLPWLA